MPQNPPQSYEKHTRFDPPFHFFAMPIAFITVCLAISNMVRRFTLVSCWLVVLSLAFLVAVFLIRTYALKVQDRVIRLEETLRLQRVLPESLRSRIGELTLGQIVGLRFASDAELPSLVEQALAQGWKSKEIKQAVREWRPDYHRV